MEPTDFQIVVCPECYKDCGPQSDVANYPGLILSFGVSPDGTPRVLMTCKRHGEMVLSTEISMDLFETMKNPLHDAELRSTSPEACKLRVVH